MKHRERKLKQGNKTMLIAKAFECAWVYKMSKKLFGMSKNK